MGSPAIFSGRRTKLLTADGVLNSDGSVNDNNGIKNYIANGHAEVGVAGWNTYANAAAARPTTGTGGAATITFTRSTSSPLSGSASFLLNSPGTVQGQGASYDFTIDSKDQAKVLQISFDYAVFSGTFVAGSSSVDSDIIVDILDITNNVIIEPSSIKLLSNSTTIADKFNATFQSSAASTSYRLILHSATASAAFSLKLDNVSVSPSTYVFGTPITDFQAFTPSGTFTTNSTYTGLWRRVGSVMEVQTLISFAGASNAANLTVNLPSGFSIDTTKIVSANNDKQVLGYGELLKSGSASYPLLVDYSTSTSVRVLVSNTLVAYGPNAFVTATVPVTLANADSVMISYEVPILGWSSSVQMSDQADVRLLLAKYRFTAATAGSPTQPLNFNTPVTDTHGAVTTGAAWKFTAPIVGKYQVNIVISSPGTTITTYLYKNGVQSEQFFTGAFTVNNGSMNGSAQIDLNAGDYIDIRFDGASTINSGYVVVNKLSGPSAIAATESLSCSYLNTSGQSIPSATMTQVTGWTKEDDSHGFFNPTTGVATIPANGRYAITFTNGYGSSAISSNTQIRIIKNSTDPNVIPFRYFYTATTINIGDSQTVIVGSSPFLSGDTIRFIVFHGATGAQPLGTGAGNGISMSIRRVGN